MSEEKEGPIVGFISVLAILGVVSFVGYHINLYLN